MNERRARIHLGLIFLGLAFLSAGRFAIFGPQETRFTNALGVMGIDLVWGAILIVTGAASLAAAFIKNRFSTVFMLGVDAIICLWTAYIMNVIAGIYTPTLEILWWFGVAAGLSAAYEANQSRIMRCARGQPHRAQRRDGERGIQDG